MITKNKYFLLSLLSIGLAILVVITLVIASNNPGLQKSSFNRKFFTKHPILLYHSGKINDVRAICGIQNKHIYFETNTAGSILETNFTLSGKRLLTFEIPDREIVQSLYNTFVDSPYCYIMAGNVPGVIRVSIETEGSSYEFFRFRSHLFSQSAVTDDGNIILRVYQKSGGRLDQVFTRWKPATGAFFTKDNILEKRGDAGFSTDGAFTFDKNTGHILYVEFYTNQFICMDTLLHVLYKGQTVGTSSLPAIHVLTETSRYSKSITNASPLYEINLESKAANGKLFIHSAVRARNESSKKRNGHAAIDIYQISDGHYLGSFYIPEYKEERLTDFEITGDKIVVLYHNYFAIYSIPFAL